MKNIKKIVAVLLSMTAIASTTAFAAVRTEVATYASGTATLEADFNAAADDQLTVVIVPKDAEEITSGNIYYINQGAFGTEFAKILSEMKVKDGFGDAKDYEVRVGGVKKDGNYDVDIFYFKADAPEIIWGDADGNGIVEAYDTTHIAQYLAGYGNEITAGADADANGVVEAYDATHIAQYLAGYGNVLGPQ